MRVAAALLGVSSAVRIGRGKTTDCYTQFEGKLLLELSSSSSKQMEQMASEILKLGCTDLSEVLVSSFQAICDSAAATELMQQFKEVVVVEKDAGEYFRSTSGNAQSFKSAEVRSMAQSSFYADWQDLEARMDRVESAVAGSNGVAKFETVGQSVEGRPIKAVRLRGQRWTPGSPRVVMSFQLHAREWITGMAGVYAVEKAIQTVKQDPSWISNLEIVMIPMVNPDGFQYSITTNRFWRKNMKADQGSCVGVDLNRNWDPDWAGSGSTSSNKCSDVYYGPSAFSEPETQALKGVIDEAPFTPNSVHLDVHSYGNLILAPWSYRMALHPRRAEMDVLGEAMKAAIFAKHGKSYMYGGSEALYPASGVAPDYGTLAGGVGMTLELRPSQNNAGGRDGFAPPASAILPTVEETWEAILMSLKYANGEALPTPPPTPVPTVNPACETGSCLQWYACWVRECSTCPKCA